MRKNLAVKIKRKQLHCLSFRAVTSAVNYQHLELVASPSIYTAGAGLVRYKICAKFPFLFSFLPLSLS